MVQGTKRRKAKTMVDKLHKAYRYNKEGGLATPEAIHNNIMKIPDTAYILQHTIKVDQAPGGNRRKGKS
jgi:hypothetical protein